MLEGMLIGAIGFVITVFLWNFGDLILNDLIKPLFKWLKKKARVGND